MKWRFKICVSLWIIRESRFRSVNTRGRNWTKWGKVADSPGQSQEGPSPMPPRPTVNAHPCGHPRSSQVGLGGAAAVRSQNSPWSPEMLWKTSVDKFTVHSGLGLWLGFFWANRHSLGTCYQQNPVCSSQREWTGEESIAPVLTEVSTLLRRWTHPWCKGVIQKEKKSTEGVSEDPGNPKLWASTLECGCCVLPRYFRAKVYEQKMNSTGLWSERDISRAKESELDKKCYNTMFSNLRYIWTL